MVDGVVRYEADYTCEGSSPHPQGTFVLYEDYKKLLDMYKELYERTDALDLR